MPNIAVTFRQEVTRLSRREIRARTKPLRRTSIQARKDIANLKRQVAKLQGELKRLLRQLPGVVPAPVIAAEEGKPTRYRKEGVIAHRKRLGLSAADFGKLISVTAHSIYSWEHGAARPRKAQVAALAAIRGIGKREAMERLEQTGKKAHAGRKEKKRKTG